MSSSRDSIRTKRPITHTHIILFLYTYLSLSTSLVARRSVIRLHSAEKRDDDGVNSIKIQLLGTQVGFVMHGQHFIIYLQHNSLLAFMLEMMMSTLGQCGRGWVNNHRETCSMLLKHQKQQSRSRAEFCVGINKQISACNRPKP